VERSGVVPWSPLAGDRVGKSSITERRLFPGDVRLRIKLNTPGMWASTQVLNTAANEVKALGLVVNIQSLNTLGDKDAE
jgi:hypothetical protein